MSEAERPPSPPPATDGPGAVPILQAHELLRGGREVVIEHEGVRYRLRLTRRNKLILQK